MWRKKKLLSWRYDFRAILLRLASPIALIAILYKELIERPDNSSTGQCGNKQWESSSSRGRIMVRGQSLTPQKNWGGGVAYLKLEKISNFNITCKFLYCIYCIKIYITLSLLCNLILIDFNRKVCITHPLLWLFDAVLGDIFWTTVV